MNRLSISLGFALGLSFATSFTAVASPIGLNYGMHLFTQLAAPSSPLPAEDPGGNGLVEFHAAPSGVTFDGTSESLTSGIGYTVGGSFVPETTSSGHNPPNSVVINEAVTVNLDGSETLDFWIETAPSGGQLFTNPGLGGGWAAFWGIQGLHWGTSASATITSGSVEVVNTDSTSFFLPMAGQPNSAGGFGIPPIEGSGSQFDPFNLTIRFDTEQLDAAQSVHLTFDVVHAGVPEPSSLALLGLGLAGIGFSRRRKSAEDHRQLRNKLPSRGGWLFIANLFLFLIPGIATAGIVTISDSGFADADYSDSITINPPNSCCFVSASGFARHETRGSNDVLGVSMAVNSGRIGIAHLYNIDTFRPFAQGSINSLTFNVTTVHESGDSETWFWALEQAGTLFLGDSQNNASGSPTLFTKEFLQATQFVESLDRSFVNLDLTSHPDFSASGGAIAFGFLFAQGSGGTVSDSGYFDDFSVEINAVPEPSTDLLILIGLTGLTILGRNRRRREIR